MKAIFVGLVLLVSFSALVQCDPAFPVWPLKFSQDFIETFQGATNHTNVGGYYYDYTTYSTRLVRSNGKYDPCCNGYKNYKNVNAVCEHIVVGENRFIYYPDDNDCCWCCSATQGCGALRPDWLKGGEYLGTTTLYGKEVFIWQKLEYPDLKNYVYETTEENPLDRTLVKIQRSSYNQVYLEETKRLDDFAPITIPSVCNVNNICPVGMCAKFRGETPTAAHAHQ